MDFGNTAVIAGDQSVENLSKPQPRLAVDAAHDAKINRANPVTLHRKEVALMKVGMEKALGDGLAKESTDKIGGELGAIKASRRERIVVSQLDPVDPIERHHAL